MSRGTIGRTITVNTIQCTRTGPNNELIDSEETLYGKMSSDLATKKLREHYHTSGILIRDMKSTQMYISMPLEKFIQDCTVKNEL